MPTTDRPYEFIETADALAEFANAELDAADGAPIALDIEEDREHGYDPTVALIQITVEARDYVIDPLALPAEALDPVIEFLCLASSAVVMHGCRNDVTGLKRDFGVGPKTVCDTQTAARFLGANAFGLAALLEERFDVRLDKAVRRSNWLRRPLTQDQLDYAREDTRYLLPLWAELADEVEAAGWSDALTEECSALGDLPAEKSEFDPFGWRRIKGAKQLSDAEQLRAAATWRWRDRTAAVVDRHPSRLLAPWALIYLARHGARAVEERAKAVPSKLATEHLDTLVDVLEAPPDVPLRPPRPPRRKGARVDSDTMDARMARLSRWRAEISEATGLDPGFLAPRSVLESVARADVEHPDEFADVEDVRKWRADRWGSDWLAMR